jgi:hypothetical protein
MEKTLGAAESTAQRLFFRNPSQRDFNESPALSQNGCPLRKQKATRITPMRGVQPN